MSDTPPMNAEIDVDEALRKRFLAGEGVVCLQKDMPDAAILLAIKTAASYGVPFKVIPAGQADARGIGHHVIHAEQSLDDLRKAGF